MTPSEPLLLEKGNQTPPHDGYVKPRITLSLTWELWTFCSNFSVTLICDEFVDHAVITSRHLLTVITWLHQLCRLLSQISLADLPFLNHFDLADKICLTALFLFNIFISMFGGCHGGVIWYDKVMWSIPWKIHSKIWLANWKTPCMVSILLQSWYN